MFFTKKNGQSLDIDGFKNAEKRKTTVERKDHK